MRLQTAITIGEYPDSTEAPSQPLVRRISSLGKRTQIYVGVSSAWIDWRAGAQIRAFGHVRLQTSPRMSAVGGKADVARRWSAFPLIAKRRHSVPVGTHGFWPFQRLVSQLRGTTHGTPPCRHSCRRLPVKTANLCNQTTEHRIPINGHAKRLR